MWWEKNFRSFWWVLPYYDWFCRAFAAQRKQWKLLFSSIYLFSAQKGQKKERSVKRLGKKNRYRTDCCSFSLLLLELDYKQQKKKSIQKKWKKSQKNKLGNKKNKQLISSYQNKSLNNIYQCSYNIIIFSNTFILNII